MLRDALIDSGLHNLVQSADDHPPMYFASQGDVANALRRATSFNESSIVMTFAATGHGAQGVEFAAHTDDKPFLLAEAVTRLAHDGKIIAAKHLLQSWETDSIFKQFAIDFVRHAENDGCYSVATARDILEPRVFLDAPIHQFGGFGKVRHLLWQANHRVLLNDLSGAQERLKSALVACPKLNTGRRIRHVLDYGSIKESLLQRIAVVGATARKWDLVVEALDGIRTEIGETSSCVVAFEVGQAVGAAPQGVSDQSWLTELPPVERAAFLIGTYDNILPGGAALDLEFARYRAFLGTAYRAPIMFKGENMPRLSPFLENWIEFVPSFVVDQAVQSVSPSRLPVEQKRLVLTALSIHGLPDSGSRALVRKLERDDDAIVSLFAQNVLADSRQLRADEIDVERISASLGSKNHPEALLAARVTSLQRSDIAPQLQEELESLEQNPDDATRLYAFSAVAVGDVRVRGLIELTASTDPSVAGRACLALAQDVRDQILGADELAALRRALSHECRFVRICAARALVGDPSTEPVATAILVK